ncbi:MAG TPA: hypothetical protein VMB19_03075 [Silvibacterium sp.]|nr:hypothetical protein [Silvibacterium sp.]
MLSTACIHAQDATSGPWVMQSSGTKAGLRGIHAVGGGVAWASGTNGTVLRTEDSGYMWQSCAMPPGAEKLDFRGIWAWDANTAIVMSSGRGDLSRLYKTTDGCSSWKLLITNPDKDGFWDAVVFQNGDFGFAIGDANTGVLIGDPVNGRFVTQVMLLGHGWFIDDSSCKARPGEAAFAASNSSVFIFGSRRYIIGTGGKGGSRALISPLLATGYSDKPCREVSVPVTGGSDSAGVFSLAFRDLKHGIAVGGDYKKPSESVGTAAWTADGGEHWTAAERPPHGYRSAVAWDAKAKAWIAVGTNGSDVSYDDGKTWSPLDDGNWNALSLPWVVGPEGRIAKLGTLPVRK